MSTLISVADAARALSLSPQQIRSMCREGKLPASMIGNTWIIDSEDTVYKSLLPLQNSHNVKPLEKSEAPIAFSFFSGAMGLDLGLEKAGFDIRLACEIDKHCQRTIMLNRQNIKLIDDVTKYNKQEIFKLAGLNEFCEIDLIAGGPPCQAFSTAGNRKGFEDSRGNVFLHFIDLALDISPKFILIENVRGLLSAPMKHRPHSMRTEDFPPLEDDELRGGALNFVINQLESKGYSCSFNLYNSANYGSPQVRERVILICSRDGDAPPHIPPTHSERGINGLKPWRTFREATSDLAEHTHINFPEKRLKYYSLLKQGQNWRALPDELQKEAMGKSYFSGGGKTGFLRRIHWDKPAPTLVTHPAMPATDLAHPEENRPLSVEEYKRIQEFPDDWKLAGKILEQYKQVGNAVPHSLALAAGKHIIKLLKGEKITPSPNAIYSRYNNTDEVSWRIEFEKSKVSNKSKQQSLFS